jgi:Flp pilus assembly protein TadG
VKTTLRTPPKIDLAGMPGCGKSKVRSRGQILVLFVMAIFVFTGMVALVVDVSWYWVNSLRVQRAADAAALAGVVQLPTRPNGTGGAYALAIAEAMKNGYDDALADVTVTPVQDPPVTGRRLNVTISAPVGMFFMKIFRIDSITATRTAKAEFVLPVPMGSPENYYGVFGPTRGLTNTATTTTTSSSSSTMNSGWTVAATSPGAAGWTTTSGTLVSVAATNNNRYALTTWDGNLQEFGSFGLFNAVAANQTVTAIRGIEVRLTDAIKSESNCTTAKIRVALSYNQGANWTSPIAGNLTGNLSTSNQTFTFGSSSSFAAWPLASPSHSWDVSDLSNTNFRLRLTANKSGGSCSASNEIRLDMLEVRATYTVDTTTTTTSTVTTVLPDQNLQGPGTACATVAGCYAADGATLNPRGFWGTMNTQGAASINGDAYQPYYDTVGGATNPEYDGSEFYNYAVEMPPGATNGAVFVYDPVFCNTAVNKGTADRWFSGAGDRVSSFFELYDTQGTLYETTDDGSPLASSDGLFRGISAADTTMGGSGGSQCRRTSDAPYGDGRDYHNVWYLLASGLTGGTNGTVYRLHTTSTDPANPFDQRGTDGENSFALYASAGGGTPRIYGIGAMQMFTPLSASGSTVQSEFYLAQIEAVHAGKTVEISLWDPGDTRPLGASIEILVPDSGGWTRASVNHFATRGNSNAASCTATGAGVPSIRTNVGDSTGTYNGCWLTITVAIPGDYMGDQDGWWKIRYSMTGTGTSNDVTTWRVAIRGNPVHLIVP